MHSSRINDGITYICPIPLLVITQLMRLSCAIKFGERVLTTNNGSSPQIFFCVICTFFVEIALPCAVPEFVLFCRFVLHASLSTVQSCLLFVILCFAVIRHVGFPNVNLSTFTIIRYISRYFIIY